MENYILAEQLKQNALMFNALNPGYAAPLSQSLEWSGLVFAEYVLTLGSSSGLGAFLPTLSIPTAMYPNPPPASPGSPKDFIAGLYENALGRSPSADELAYYEQIINTHKEGYAITLVGIATSPEAQAHNPIVKFT